MSQEFRPNTQNSDKEIQALIEVWQTVKALRDRESGCPWDLQQTHQSLLRYLIEESYEFCHAAQDANDAHMRDELGDVLFQVLLHCSIGEERKAFDISEVSKNLQEKLIRRHPHVFSKQATNHSGQTISAEEVAKRWEEIKQVESGAKSKNNYLGDSWRSLPSLLAAFKIGEKTNKIKFDWDNYQQVVYKVEEEWQELKEELAASKINRQKVSEEIGDLLFTVAQLARHLDVGPEECLAKANQKFATRFSKMQDLIEADGKMITEMNQSQMDQYWNKVKSLMSER